jgi:hypothetical protein
LIWLSQYVVTHNEGNYNDQSDVHYENNKRPAICESGQLCGRVAVTAVLWRSHDNKAHPEHDNEYTGALDSPGERLLVQEVSKHCVGRKRSNPAFTSDKSLGFSVYSFTYDALTRSEQRWRGKALRNSLH